MATHVDVVSIPARRERHGEGEQWSVFAVPEAAHIEEELRRKISEIEKLGRTVKAISPLISGLGDVYNSTPVVNSMGVEYSREWAFGFSYTSAFLIVSESS